LSTLDNVLFDVMSFAANVQVQRAVHEIPSETDRPGTLSRLGHGGNIDAFSDAMALERHAGLHNRAAEVPTPLMSHELDLDAAVFTRSHENHLRGRISKSAGCGRATADRRLSQISLFQINSTTLPLSPSKSDEPLLDVAVPAWLSHHIDHSRPAILDSSIALCRPANPATSR
jgi:hypothetical protein